MADYRHPREDDVRKRLHRHGRRMTPQRRAILRILLESDGHPTAEEIYDRVQKEIPRISLGTVYRNLQVLVDEQYVNRLPATEGSHRYEKVAVAHHHAVCVDCRRIIDVHLEEDPRLREQLSQRYGFEVADHRTEFRGLCSECGGNGKATEA
jgi:Fe2+ or Zn2+ uptake regulation protein